MSLHFTLSLQLITGVRVDIAEGGRYAMGTSCRCQIISMLTSDATEDRNDVSRGGRERMCNR